MGSLELAVGDLGCGRVFRLYGGWYAAATPPYGYAGIPVVGVV